MSILNFKTLVALTLVFSSFSNVISSNTCNFNVKMKQVLHNDGFHRNLTYGIVFNAEKSEQQRLYRDCIVALEQGLPPGVFVNPDELKDFKRMRKLNTVLTNKVNVELPAEQSNPIKVYVIGRIKEDKVSLWLPVHARYHKAVRGGGYARNNIGPPKLYLSCPDQRLDVCDITQRPTATFLCNGSADEKCKWKEIPYELMTDKVTWDVVVGNLDHYYFVATTSAFTVFFGATYLLLALHRFKTSLFKKIKHD